MLYKLSYKFILLFLAVFYLNPVFCQWVDYDKASGKVLLENLPNKTYRFRGIVASINSYYTYLGSVHCGSRILKLINTKTIWGPNKHNYASILIFNAKNKYIGRYHLGDARDLPVKLLNGAMLFSNKNKDCTTPVYKRISLKHGLPRTIFVPACNDMGDLYYFGD